MSDDPWAKAAEEQQIDEEQRKLKEKVSDQFLWS